MGSGPDASTSQTLLRILTGPESDDSAWRTFHERYEVLIQKWCRRWDLHTADVEEITQVVLLKLFGSLRSYDARRGKFRPWLHQVVRNAVCDLSRQRARVPGGHGSGDSGVERLLQDIEEPDPVDSLVDELDSSIGVDLQTVMMRVQERVQPKTWEAFRLAKLEVQPLETVAEQLGMSYTAVGMGISRARKMLAEEWAKLLHADDGRNEKQE
jgi:RNA polymerase sigma-70 factor (ECF subfamily)